MEHYPTVIADAGGETNGQPAVQAEGLVFGLMKRSTYRHIVTATSRLYSTSAGQFFLQQYMPRGLRYIMEWWHEYGRGKDESWIKDLLCDFTFPADFLPKDEIAGFLRWRCAAAWIGAEWAGMTEEEKTIRNRRERQMSRIFADRLNHPSFDRTAERIGQNTLRMADALRASIARLDIADREGPITEILSLIEFLCHEDTARATLVSATGNSIVEQVHAARVAERRVLASLGEASADDTQTQKNAAAADRERLEEELADAQSVIAELTNRVTVSSNTVQEYAETVSRLNQELKNLQETIKEGAPLHPDEELDTLLAELLVLAQEIPALQQDLDAASGELDRRSQDHAIALRRVTEGTAESEAALAASNAAIIAASKDRRRIQATLEGLNGRRMTVMEDISSRMHELSSQLITDTHASKLQASTEQRSIDPEDESLEDEPADKPTDDPVDERELSNEDLLRAIDALKRPNQFLSVSGPTANAFGYFQGRGLLSTPSGLLLDVASGTIDTKIAEWKKARRINRSGERQLQSLVTHVLRCGLIGPEKTLNWAAIRSAYENALKRQNQEQTAESASATAHRVAEPTAAPVPREQRLKDLAILREFQPFEFLECRNGVAMLARTLTMLTLQGVVNSNADCLISIEEGTLLERFITRAHELGWSKAKIENRNRARVESLISAIGNLPIWDETRIVPRQLDLERLNAYTRQLWKRYRMS